MPRFSVVLPTHDRSAAIRPTLDAVCAQSEQDWELLVVSDASTDDTDAVVAAHPDPRIRLHRLEQRAGHPGPPRDAGLALASGELVAYLDHDDVWRPDHLARLGALLERAPVAATGRVEVDEGGRPVSPPTGLLDAVWSPELQVLAPLFEPSRVGHRAGLAEAVGGWWRGPAGLEDWDLWLRLADAGHRVATTAEPTVRLLSSGGTRRHTMGVRFEDVLGHLPTLEAGRRVLALLAEEPLRGRLRALHLAAATAWHEEEHAAGSLVLPEEAPASPDLGALLDAAVGEDTVTPVLGVRELEPGGRAVVARPLLCTTAEHAARIGALGDRRFAAKRDVVRRVIGAVARSAA